MATQPETTQTPGVSTNNQLMWLLAAIGALVGVAFMYAVTQDVVAALFGAPIGGLIAMIAFRAVPRIVHKADPVAQANGAAPASPAIEETEKPAFRMKSRVD